MLVDWLFYGIDNFCSIFVIMMQGHHFAMLQHETEKLKGDIEKMRSELRFVMECC